MIFPQLTVKQPEHVQLSSFNGCDVHYKCYSKCLQEVHVNETENAKQLSTLKASDMTPTNVYHSNHSLRLNNSY